jgi:hypothetical protein
MAKTVFSRSSGKSISRKLTVSTESIVRRVLANPGDYTCTVAKAALIEPRNAGNISAVIELVDPPSGDYFDLRPLWIDGPNAANGNMAARNIAVIADLLEAIGIPPGSYKELNDELLARLIDKTFELTLDLDRGGRGGMFNIIVRVNGTIDPADVVQFPNSAAD